MVKAHGNKDTIEFQSRLTAALAKSADIPPPGKGQQTELASRLGVSQEAVRNWVHGRARPRPELMQKLADLLGTDPAWLALGLTPSGEQPQRNSLRRDRAGGVYYVFGLFSLQGGTPAFSDTNGVDIVSVVDNQARYYSVYLGYRSRDDVCTVEIPEGVHPDSQILVPVADSVQGRVPVVRLSRDHIDEYGEDAGGYTVLRMKMSRVKKRYVFTVGDDVELPCGETADRIR